MVRRAAARALTPLSFRRDVRLFLASLVGFLVVLLAGTLLLMQSFEQETETAIRDGWDRSANLAARELTALSDSERSDLETRLLLIQARYDIAGLILAMPKRPPIVTGVTSVQPGLQTITRTLPFGTLVATFDASTLEHTRRTFIATSVITLVAATLATILLMLYMPRITEPVERMLESAAEVRDRLPHDDEQQYLIDTFRDSITTLKTQEAELQRLHQNERTRADDLERVTAALTRSIGSGFLSVDPDGRIVDANGVARETLAMREGQSTIAEALGATEFARVLEEAVASQRAITREELTINSDGVQHMIGLTTVPLIGVDRQFLGMLALFTDLTPVRRLESRVREMQTLADLGEIAAGIAHEFRNSLSAILGFLRLSKNAATAESRRPIENAEREAQSLSQAVDALLTFAKPMHFEADVVDLNDVANNIVQKLRLQFGGVPIELTGAETLVRGDASLLGRALENLVRNAIDSVKRKGDGGVRVFVDSTNDAEVRIEDDGVGIDPANVSRFFLPFQSDSPGGYGIGLPLVKKIVLLHEGSVELAGEPGRGARAVVRLPLAAAVDTKSDNFDAQGS